MKTVIIRYKQTWRDVLVILTAVLVLGSLVLVAYGISQNNRLANQSKDHIDCIIKDLATPRPINSAQKYIDVTSILSKDCKIKFSQ